MDRTTEISGAPAARLSVGIISAGRVGTAFGVALERVGHVVYAVSAVSDASISRAQSRLPESRILPAHEVAAAAELLILAVPDAELTQLVAGLAGTGAVRPGTIVAHTSGANGVAILEPLARQGILPLALHPAMTFTGHAEDDARLSSACFGVTAADEVGYAVGTALVLEMGGEPVRVEESVRALYHAALAHGSNHLVTLVADAVDALHAALAADTSLVNDAVLADERGRAGSSGVAERMLAPLLSAALDNVLRHGQSALTGPVARDDAAAVAVHLRELGRVDPRIAAGYRALALRTAQRSKASAVLAELTETR